MTSVKSRERNRLKRISDYQERKHFLNRIKSANQHACQHLLQLYLSGLFQGDCAGGGQTGTRSSDCSSFIGFTSSVFDETQP